VPAGDSREMHAALLESFDARLVGYESNHDGRKHNAPFGPTRRRVAAIGQGS